MRESNGFLTGWAALEDCWAATTAERARRRVLEKCILTVYYLISVEK